MISSRLNESINQDANDTEVVEAFATVARFIQKATATQPATPPPSEACRAQSLLKPKEAARYFGTSLSTLQALLKAHPEAVVPIGKSVRVDVAKFEAALRARGPVAARPRKVSACAEDQHVTRALQRALGGAK